MKKLLISVVLTLSVSNALTLSQEQNQKEFNVKVGEEITLNLPENPSTGYRWFALEQDKTLKTLSSKYVATPKSDPMIVGAGGTKSYRYKAAKAGQTAIQLVLLPPGRGREVAELVQFYITVK